MAGDDLTILLFFLSCAVTFGVETANAETSLRRLAFGFLTLACLGSGVLWQFLKTILATSITENVAAVATNPVSWFVIAMFLLAVLPFISREYGVSRKNR
jgi:hypothetical protein